MTPDEIIGIIKSSRSDKDLHDAGNQMRDFINSSPDLLETDRKKILNTYRNKSENMVSVGAGARTVKF